MSKIDITWFSFFDVDQFTSISNHLILFLCRSTIWFIGTGLTLTGFKRRFYLTFIIIVRGKQFLFLALNFIVVYSNFDSWRNDEKYSICMIAWIQFRQHNSIHYSRDVVCCKNLNKISSLVKLSLYF